MENKTSIKVFLALMLAVLMPVVSCINVSNAVLSDGDKYEFEDGIHKGAQIYTDYVGQMNTARYSTLPEAHAALLHKRVQALR